MDARAQELLIYSDGYRESPCVLDVEVGEMFDIWLWARPSDEGLRAVELKTVVSDFMYMPFVPTYNPDATLYFGSFPDGVLAVSLNSCHTDWVWIVKTTLFVVTMPAGCQYIAINPWTGQPYPKTLNCSYEEEPVLWTAFYEINCPMPCEYCWCYCRSAEISGIDVEDETHIVMHLDCPTSLDAMLSIDNYSLCEKNNPENTIPIIGITYDDEGASAYIHYYYTFSLDEALMPNVIYTLHVDYIDSWVGDWDGAEFDFVYPLIATLLQDFAAVLKAGRIELSWSISPVDNDVEFAVLRRVLGSDWTELPSNGVERTDLSFTYFDDRIEPGESYFYRVDYTLGAETGVLFETDAVQTPAAPLTLHQNVPNPFNPTTEISYYLPAAADVMLEVYDVTGKRVATLERGRREKGLHVVSWQGIDDAGHSAQSGIYFYRLRAGNEVVSKKMVLLR
jgi:hypothetical protein